jgi:hypothetical protein
VDRLCRVVALRELGLSLDAIATEGAQDRRQGLLLAVLLECGLLHGSFTPSAAQKQVRDLTWCRMKAHVGSHLAGPAAAQGAGGEASCKRPPGCPHSGVDVLSSQILLPPVGLDRRGLPGPPPSALTS